jgi:acyl transferase domain-containing protein
MSNQRNEPIAVVGIGCRFPGGCDTPSKLWELLKNPNDLSREIPPERFNVDRFYHKTGSHHGTTNVRRAYMLSEDISQFDHQFFSITPDQAAAIDPQQRLLLEVTYEAVESSGYTMEKLNGSDTAVFVGMMNNDYLVQQALDVDFSPKYNATGVANSNASSRISYFFDWHGPSVVSCFVHILNVMASVNCSSDS